MTTSLVLRGPLTWFVAVVMLASAVTLGASASTLAQDGTPPADATAAVPAVPPWRAELIPRNRPLVVTVGDTDIPVEVANNATERQLGLGERDGLLPGTGMLFVFGPQGQIQNFWMGGMRFCLDIVWLNEGAITGAAQSTCPGPPDGSQDEVPRHQSPGVTEYVLELPAGFLAEHGYGVGTPITFSEDPYGLPIPEEGTGG